MTSLKLIAIGRSIGAVLPEEILTRLNVSKGDMLYLTETPDGGYRLTSYDPSFAEKMEKTDTIMRRYSGTLKTLTK